MIGSLRNVSIPKQAVHLGETDALARLEELLAPLLKESGRNAIPVHHIIRSLIIQAGKGHKAREMIEERPGREKEKQIMEDDSKKKS